jgi:ketosteroid isomerase-like protein
MEKEGVGVIRRKLDALAEALRAKDIDSVMAHYGRDNITFDVQPPLQVNGRDAYRKNFESWFSIIDGSIGYEVRDLEITADGDVAFCHSVCRAKSTRINGEKADYSVRVTSCMRRINGEWLITHEHVSLPVDMRTGRAALLS